MPANERVAIVNDVFAGWGALVAAHLARAGMHIVVSHALQDGRVERACESLRQLVPQANLTAIHLDRESPASVASFVQQFASRFGRLDVLLTDANVARVERRASGEACIEYNAGAFSLLRGLWPFLVRAAPSRVVLMTNAIVPIALRASADSGRVHNRAQVDREAADTSFTRVLAEDGVAQGISVNLYGLFGTRDFEGRPFWYRALAPLFEGSRRHVLATSQQVADMIIHLATLPELANAPARHYVIKSRKSFPLGHAPEVDANIERMWSDAAPVQR